MGNRRTRPATAANLDPTRTGRHRISLRRESAAKFGALRADVIRLIVTDDPLGESGGSASASSRAWVGLSRDEVMSRFKTWLSSRTTALFRTQWDRPLRAHLERAYTAGVSRAYDDVTRGPRALASVKEETSHAYRGGRSQQISHIVRSPESSDKIASLVLRAGTAVEALVTAVVGSGLVAFGGALESGAGARQMASSVVAKLSPYQTRAAAITDTEIVRAYNEGYLRALRHLNVTEAHMTVEWTSSKSGMCRRCSDLAGSTVPVASAGGVLPHHVGCRCAWSVGPAPVANTRTEDLGDFDRLLNSILTRREAP